MVLIQVLCMYGTVLWFSLLVGLSNVGIGAISYSVSRFWDLFLLGKEVPILIATVYTPGLVDIPGRAVLF